MQRVLFSFSIVFFLSVNLLAQATTKMAIGEWKLYPSYRSPKSVASADNHLFYAADFGIVKWDKEDESIKIFDLVSGLHDTDIRFVKYNPGGHQLFVIYQNSNIDVIQEDETVIELPVVFNQQIVGDKQIYDVFFANGKAFLSCGFGLVAINTDNLEVAYSTFTEEPMHGITLLGDTLFASLTGGIYKISASHPGIQDFQNWNRINEIPGTGLQYIGALPQAGRIVFGTEAALYSFDLTSGALDTIFAAPKMHFVSLTSGTKGLTATFYCKGPGQWSDCDGEVITIGPSGYVEFFSKPKVFRPRFAVRDADGIFTCDEWYPYRKIFPDGSGYEKVLEVNTPYSSEAFGSAVYGDTLYVVAGKWSPTKSFPLSLSAGGYFTQDLNTGIWDFVNSQKYHILSDSMAQYNFMDLVVHPVNHKKYIATFGGGLIEQDGENFKFYNNYNSPLRPEPGYTRRVGVIDLALDDENNLWMTNYNTPNGLAVLKNDGSWQSFYLGAGNTFVNRLLIDDFGNKWIILVGRGLLVYSNGQSLNDLSDDQYRLLNSSNSELQTNQINDFALDQDGNIWVGTDVGVVVFECGGEVFDEEICRGSRRIATLDGFGAYLLEDEAVTAVAVDPANRKWFGTTDGIFVLSPTGEEVLARFNTSNSPLPHNRIDHLSIDEKTGTVYIGTPFGLAAYRSEAVKGGPLHLQDVYAYPNPVRPDYTGPIAIKGLAQNAKVKITDVEGRLVYETDALGGQAIWDGNDYTGRPVESGVYLVFSAVSTSLDVDAAVAKIVIVR